MFYPLSVDSFLPALNHLLHIHPQLFVRVTNLLPPLVQPERPIWDEDAPDNILACYLQGVLERLQAELARLITKSNKGIPLCGLQGDVPHLSIQCCTQTQRHPVLAAPTRTSRWSYCQPLQRPSFLLTSRHRRDSGQCVLFRDGPSNYSVH